MNFITYKKSELYDRVVDEYDIFEYSYDFMVFLAVLGYLEGEADRKNFEGNEDDGTRGQIGVENFFSNELYRIVAMSIAFQDTGRHKALVDVETQAEKLAQHAAGGLRVAEAEFGGIAGDPTDAMVNFVQNRDEAADNGYQGTLGEIVEAFDEELQGAATEEPNL